MIPGTCLLVMELLGPLTQLPPPWADYVDCAQVGLARDGNVRAYDFGWPLPRGLCLATTTAHT